MMCEYELRSDNGEIKKEGGRKVQVNDVNQTRVIFDIQLSSNETNTKYRRHPTIHA